MKKNHKVGIIGTGNIAKKFHIPAWISNKKVKVNSAADINLDVLNKIKKKFKIKKIHKNYINMLKKNNLDIISISTPPNQHLKNISDSIRANKNIFVEKPFVINTKEFFKIKNLVNLKKKSYIQCALHQRYRPISTSIRNSLRKKEIGNLYYINIIHRRFRNIPKHSHVFSNKKLSGGGPLMDLGWHYFDLVFWLLNFPKLKKWDCNIFKKIFSNKAMKRYLVYKKFNNEEFVVGNIITSKNIRINFELSYAINTNKEETKIELFGDKGCITWPEKNYYILKKNKLVKKKFSLGNELASRLQIDNFLKKMSYPKNTNANLKEYFYTINLIEKLYKASQK